MKKTLSILSLVLVFALALTACGGASSSSAPAPASTPASTAEPASAAEPASTGSASVEGKEVTMILKNLTNPFFISVKEGAEKAAEELGIKLTVLAPLKADNNEEQTQMVEQAIASQDVYKRQA